ncbi:MAG TPA: c-type cytochrome [Solirubrobacteraceae bacterium]|nr:c-type cytochrome [Solirubrobacteraceae bacterium]
MRPITAKLLPALGAAACVVALSGCEIKHSDDNLIAGKQLFVAKCGSCHTLSRAGTKGTVGPDLDAAFARDLGEGFQRDTVRGVVHAQILNPGRGTAMPPNLVTGQKANDVAAYVAFAAARSGQDSGLLAAAVAPAGAGKPAVASGGNLEIDADPSGQLAYVTNKASAPPGSLTIKMKNGSSTPHNIALEGAASAAGPVVQSGGVSSFQVTLKPGTYTYFCQVQGHRQGGMLGTLTVK